MLHLQLKMVIVLNVASHAVKENDRRDNEAMLL